MRENEKEREVLKASRPENFINEPKVSLVTVLAWAYILP